MRRIHIPAQAEDSHEAVRNNARILHIRPCEEEKNEQKKSRSSERSHSKPWHADEPKQKRTVNNVSEEEPREHRHHHRGKGERDRHMIVTIAKNDTTKAEETVAVEERKFHSVSSMARTKAIGQMNALSPLKGKKSLIGRIPT